MTKFSFPLVLSTTSIPDSNSQLCFSASAREPAPKLRLLDVWAPNVHLPFEAAPTLTPQNSEQMDMVGASAGGQLYSGHFSGLSM